MLLVDGLTHIKNVNLYTFNAVIFFMFMLKLNQL